MTITVYGEPKRQPRQRHAVIAGHVRNYTPTDDPVNAYKASIRQAWQEAVGKYHEGPVRVEVHVYFGRPKSHYRTGKRSHELKPTSPIYHAKKPDADNVLKAIKDALTGVAWRDDSQVADVRVIKYYATQEPPKTVVRVMQLGEP